METDLEQRTKQWEANIDAVFADENAVAAEMNFCMRSGDLLGAAMACFDHVQTSYQQGRFTDAKGYLEMGQMLMQADGLITMENDEEDTRPKIFKIPDCIFREPQLKEIRYYDDGEFDESDNDSAADLSNYSLMRTAELQDSVRAAVAEVEAMIGLDVAVDILDKNKSIFDAIGAINTYINAFEDLLKRKIPYEHDDNKKLLRLAYQIASCSYLSEEFEVCGTAYNSYRLVADMAASADDQYILRKVYKSLDKLEDEVDLNTFALFVLLVNDV